MKLIKDIREMQLFSMETRKQGKSISFVPTMGCLHNGHISLLKKGRVLGDVLVMSIFVNPIQFGPKEDYVSYPKDLNTDLIEAGKHEVDVVFSPAAEEMYPNGYETYIEVQRLSKPLCGLSRPGHFCGVATVVAKLFNIVKPNIAVFGEKDFQQLTIIKKMIRDLNMETDIISVPIVREADGLAMSSRNNYLNKEERKAASCINTAILKGKKLFDEGINKTEIILKTVRNIIEIEPLITIDYITICNINTLEDLIIVKDKAILAIAVKIGKTRLIDNCVLEKGEA